MISEPGIIAKYFRPTFLLKIIWSIFSIRTLGFTVVVILRVGDQYFPKVYSTLHALISLISFFHSNSILFYYVHIYFQELC